MIAKELRVFKRAIEEAAQVMESLDLGALYSDTLFLEGYDAGNEWMHDFLRDVQKVIAKRIRALKSTRALVKV